MQCWLETFINSTVSGDLAGTVEKKCCVKTIAQGAFGELFQHTVENWNCSQVAYEPEQWLLEDKLMRQTEKR